MPARRKGRTMPRPESAAQRFLAQHRKYADECVDNIHRFVPNQPAETLADLPAGLLVPVADAPLPVYLIPLRALAAPQGPTEVPTEHVAEFARASVKAVGQTLHELARRYSVNRVAIVVPLHLSDDIYMPQGGPLAGQTVAGTSSTVMVTVITPAAHETWFATTVWRPDVRMPHTQLTAQPHDYVFGDDTLTSFAEMLSQG
jgi:hypothetical protein